MLSGEITSQKAKRVLYPLFWITLLNFVLFCVRWQITKASGQAGMVDESGYTVVEHGQSFHLTTTVYWLGRIHLLSVLVSILTVVVVRAYFFHTGDLKKTARESGASKVRGTHPQ